MEREEFFKLMNERYDSLTQLKEEKSFYEFEKKFEDLWLKAGRSVMEGIIGKPGANRRKKNFDPIWRSVHP